MNLTDNEIKQFFKKNNIEIINKNSLPTDNIETFKEIPLYISFYNAYDIQFLSNESNNFEIFSPYEDVFDSKIVLPEDIKHKIFYNYECNLYVIEDKIKQLPINSLLQYCNFFVCRILLINNKLFLSGYATSKEDADKKGLTYRRTK